jgi:four helix bundle protein
MRGARHFTELIVWTLADAIRVEVFTLTERPAFRRDLKAKSQLDDAANSVCRNIAEGFGCDTHGEFARFLEIARRSLNEIQDCLLSARLQRWVTEEDCRPIRALLKRIFPALSRFIAYLRRTPDFRMRPHQPAKAPRTDKDHVRTDKRRARTDT